MHRVQRRYRQEMNISLQQAYAMFHGSLHCFPTKTGFILCVILNIIKVVSRQCPIVHLGLMALGSIARCALRLQTIELLTSVQQQVCAAIVEVCRFFKAWLFLDRVKNFRASRWRIEACGQRSQQMKTSVSSDDSYRLSSKECSWIALGDVFSCITDIAAIAAIDVRFRPYSTADFPSASAVPQCNNTGVNHIELFGKNISSQKM